MRASSACAALALVAIPALVASAATPPPGKSGPPVIPYVCSEGRPASVVYESGSDFLHARALVTYDGRTFELESAPTLYGVRYRGEAAGQSTPLAWTLWGEQAWLTDSPDADGYTRQERELTRCVRLRGAIVAAAPADEEQSEGHSDDH